MSELPRGTRFVTLHFDPDVVPTHPRTGDRMPPPVCLAALCRPEAVGWVKARLVALVDSTGWRADLDESYLWKEDDDQGDRGPHDG